MCVPRNFIRFCVSSNSKVFLKQTFFGIKGEVTQEARNETNLKEKKKFENKNLENKKIWQIMLIITNMSSILQRSKI